MIFRNRNRRVAFGFRPQSRDRSRKIDPSTDRHCIAIWKLVRPQRIL
jgi:hypothetical protein